MKNFYIIVIFSICFIAFFGSKVLPSQISQDNLTGEYYFYVNGSEEKGKFYSAVKNGEQTVLNCPIYEAEIRKSEIKGDILGESYTILGQKKEGLKIIEKYQAKIVSSSQTGEAYIYYLYSDKVNSKSLNLFGEKVNLQIAITNGKVHVGFPILLGGY